MKRNAIEYLYDKSSLSAKQKEEWYTSAIDEIIKYVNSLPINDKDTVAKDINLSHGKVDTSFILDALRPYIPPEGQAALEEGHFLYAIGDDRQGGNAGKVNTLLPEVDFIHQIRDRFVGEYVRQFSELQAYNRDPKAVIERNQKLEKLIRVLIESSIVKLIEGKMQEEELESIDFEKHEKEFLDKWIDDKTIEYQHRLNLLNDLTNADINYLQAFLWWFATEQVYTYRAIYGNNKMRKEVVHPLEYYRVPSSVSPFVKDDVAGVRKYKLNIKDIITYFQDDLSETDISYIKELMEKHRAGEGYAVPHYLLASRRTIHGNYSDNDIIMFSQTEDVNIYHVVFQSIYPIKLLTYVDIDGTIKKMEVNKEYELDEETGDIHLETIDTFVTLEMYRIGEEDSGIYIKPKELPVQTGVLPYNGITGFLGTGGCNPIPRRVAGLLALYKFYTLQQQRAVAKHKNWIVVPDSIITDSAEMTREERLEFAKKDDVLFINDEEATANTLQALRAIVAQNSERYVETLTNLRESVRREALDVAGMNEQRYGDSDPKAGKAVTEYAITRATTASIALFHTFNMVKERDAMLDLEYAKQIWKQGYKGTYYDRASGKVVYVDIPPEEDSPTEIGVFVKNSVEEKDKKDAMIEFAFSMGQNGQPLIAIEAIDSESATQIKRLIKDTVKEQEKLAENMQRYEEQMKVEAEKLINEREALTKEHELKIVAFKEEMANIRAILESDTDILIKTMELGKGDNSEIEAKKLELEQRKIALQKVENDLKNYSKMFDSISKREQKVQAKKAS